MPYPSWVTKNKKMQIKLFYTQCQFHATMLTVSHPGLSFASVLASSLSLCMTLVRKGRLQRTVTTNLRTVPVDCVPAFFAVFAKGAFDAAMYLGPMSSLAKTARVKHRVNKYGLWIVFVTIAVLLEYVVLLSDGLPKMVHFIGCLQLLVPLFVNFAHIRHLWPNLPCTRVVEFINKIK